MGSRITVRTLDRIVACAGLVVVAAFFLPWVRIGALAGPSGWAIARESEMFGISSRGLWCVPLCGLVMMASPAFGHLARPINACAGVVIAFVTVWIVASTDSRVVWPSRSWAAPIVLAGDPARGHSGDRRNVPCGFVLLDWFGRTGYANTPAPARTRACHGDPRWASWIARGVALASALALCRTTRTLARLARRSKCSPCSPTWWSPSPGDLPCATTTGPRREHR